MRIVAGIIISAIVSFVLPTFLLIEGTDKQVVNTLYTVAGVIFSVGMSLIISVSTSGIKNRDAREVFRKQLKMIRSRFISIFVLLSLFFVLLPIGDNKREYDILTIQELPIKVSSSVFLASCLVMGIVYYIVNFYSISQSVYQMEDRIEQEN